MKKLVFFILIGITPSIVAKNINTYLREAMHTYKTPVVSYAIIDQGKIVKEQSLSIDPKIAVNNQSLFQAASMSKSVAAYAALNLVEQHRIALNKPANHYLNQWKIPSNQFNRNHPVLIYQLMSMTAGLSVSGFPGYPQGAKLPTPIQILNGKKPANTAPIRVFYQPGSRYFYSGGNFQVLEQIISDVTRKPFNQYMNHQVLNNLKMHESIFQYPLTNKKFLSRAIPGFARWPSKPIPGKWHNYMCAGAGGMWSTAGDMATFLLNVTHSLLGEKHGSLSPQLTQEMLTRQKNSDFGLGVVVNGSGKNMYFWKAGHNYGYHSLMIMFPRLGKGFVIMTNSENGNSVINFIIPLIAKKYHWPSYFPYFDELIKIPYMDNN